jgi:GDP-4-dehydro-6-deoxy-D-mannose reductase
VKALVSGATGFIGSHLTVHLAAEGWNVAVTPPGGDLATRAARLATAVDALAPMVVFHMAGLSRAAHSAALYEANLVLPAHLLAAAARQKRPPLVILAGSAAEYGNVPPDCVPVREAQPCHPLTDYGIAKYAQTLMAEARAAAGLPIVVARLWNPVGRGMPGHLALASFAAQIAAMPSLGGTLHVGNLDVERDFLDVGEVTRLMAGLATRSEAIGHVVNICAGRTWRLRSLVDDLIRLAGKPVSLEVDPRRVRAGEPAALCGHTGRLARLGLAPMLPNFDTILPQLLAAANGAGLALQPANRLDQSA